MLHRTLSLHAYLKESILCVLALGTLLRETKPLVMVAFRKYEFYASSLQCSWFCTTEISLLFHNSGTLNSRPSPGITKSLLGFRDMEPVGVSFTRTACQWKASTACQEKQRLFRDSACLLDVHFHTRAQTLPFSNLKLKTVSWACTTHIVPDYFLHFFLNTWLNLQECDFKSWFLQCSHYLFPEKCVMPADILSYQECGTRSREAESTHLVIYQKCIIRNKKTFYSEKNTYSHKRDKSLALS